MLRKRVIALALSAAILTASLLTGCGGTAGGSESKQTDGAAEEGQSETGAENKETESGEGTASTGAVTEVTFWALSTRQNAIDPIIEEFQKANPDIKVIVSYYDVDGIKDACKVAASSKTLPNMWFNWGGSLGGFYSDNGLTYDLTDYAAENGWAEKFSAGALNLCERGGQLTGYPTSFNVLDVYYRKDLFEQYGLKVPTTFEEFEKVCAVLKENGITPISTAGLNGWHVMRFVELLIEHYAGSELHDQMNTFEESYNNEAVVQALSKFQEFCQKGYFPEGFLTADPNDTQMAVFMGTAAMDIQGQWYDGSIVREEQDMNLYGTFAFPSGGTNRLSAFVEMAQFNASNTPEQLEACIRFHDYYYSNENAEKFGEYYNLPLPTNDAVMPANQPNVEIMLDTANQNGTFTITDQAFPTEVASALFDVQDAVANGQMTPQDGAAKIQTAIEAYRKK